MVNQRRIGFLLLLLLAVVAIILAIDTTLKDLRYYVSLVVSIIALFCSVVSLFKDDFFPFKLRVLAGDVILLNEPTNPAIDLILTVTFINSGYTDGVVEFIALKVTNSKGNKKLYVACNEFDNRLVFNLIRQPQTKTTNVIPFPFSAFPLPARQSIKKHLGFAWSNVSGFTRWEAERYKFELYLKSSQGKKLKKVFEFTQEMTLDDFNSYNTQESYYMAGVLERSIMKQVNEL
jgi:hypothetical protein